MAKLKIGVVGLGSIAQMHIGGYLNNPNVELYAFCDINEERLKANGENAYVIGKVVKSDECVEIC